MAKVKIKIVVFLVFLFIPKLCFSEVYSGRIFKHTFYPLDVYYVRGEKDGPTIMVQGGIQGDETSGILTAQLLTKCRLIKGNLIVVPRANPYAILLRKRGINVDLNRRFDRDYDKFYEDFLARCIKYLASLSDGLIHLHEGSGFYSPRYISPLRNPFRYGQSIIIDTSRFNGKICLASLAVKVLNRVNATIYPTHFSFNLFNMNTLSPTTKYPEQRKSFTYYVVKRLKKPAFAVEVSKNISDLKWKVIHQLRTVVELLTELGVYVSVPENLVEFVSEELKKGPDIEWKGKKLADVGKLSLYPFSLLDFKVYDDFPLRWAIVTEDRLCLNLALFRGIFPKGARSLIVTDDGRVVKRIKVKLRKFYNMERSSSALIYSLDGKLGAALPEEEIKAKEGQTLILLGVLDSHQKQIINAKGIITNPVRNDGQDLARPILLCRKRFIKSYIEPFRGGWSFYVEYVNRKIKWKVRVFYKTQMKRVLLAGDILTPVLHSQREVRILAGKYKLLPPKDRDFICFVNRSPLPLYPGDDLVFMKERVYVLKFFDPRTFSFLWSVKVRAI